MRWPFVPMTGGTPLLPLPPPDEELARDGEGDPLARGAARDGAVDMDVEAAKQQLPVVSVFDADLLCDMLWLLGLLLRVVLPTSGGTDDTGGKGEEENAAMEGQETAACMGGLLLVEHALQWRVRPGAAACIVPCLTKLVMLVATPPGTSVLHPAQLEASVARQAGDANLSCTAGASQHLVRYLSSVHLRDFLLPCLEPTIDLLLTYACTLPSTQTLAGSVDASPHLLAAVSHCATDVSVGVAHRTACERLRLVLDPHSSGYRVSPSPLGLGGGHAAVLPPTPHSLWHPTPVQGPSSSSSFSSSSPGPLWSSSGSGGPCTASPPLSGSEHACLSPEGLSFGPAGGSPGQAPVGTGGGAGLSLWQGRVTFPTHAGQRGGVGAQGGSPIGSGWVVSPFLPRPDFAVALSPVPLAGLSAAQDDEEL